MLCSIMIMGGRGRPAGVARPRVCRACVCVCVCVRARARAGGSGDVRSYPAVCLRGRGQWKPRPAGPVNWWWLLGEWALWPGCGDDHRFCSAPHPIPSIPVGWGNISIMMQQSFNGWLDS